MVDYLLLELIGKSWKALTVTAAVGTSHSMGQTSEKGLTGPRGQLQCLIVDQGCGSLVIVAVKKRLIRKLEKLPWLSHLFCPLSQFWRCRSLFKRKRVLWLILIFVLPPKTAIWVRIHYNYQRKHEKLTNIPHRLFKIQDFFLSNFHIELNSISQRLFLSFVLIILKKSQNS